MAEDTAGRGGNGREGPARRGSGSMPAVLMYHSVTPYQDDPYLVTVSPARFEAQLRWLRRRGLRGVSVAELLAARERGSGHDLVGLTFDDGYADFVEHALPALTRHGCTATVFVIAGRLGGDNAWDAEGPRKPLMTARQVRQAADAGIEIVEVWETEQALHRFLTDVLPGIWEGVGMAERMTGTPSWTIAPVHSWSVWPQPIADAAAP